MSVFRTLLILWVALVSVAQAQLIPHAIGIYISEEGQFFLKESLQNVLRGNRIQYEGTTIPGRREDLGVKTVDALVPNNPKLASLVKKSKSYFKQFFHGFSFGEKHHFQIDVSDIELSLVWNRLGLELDHRRTFDRNAKGGVVLNVVMSLNNFNIHVDKISAQDKKHSFFGEIGIDNINLFPKKDQPSLSMIIPIRIKIVGKGAKAKIVYKVEKPETNITETLLDLTFKTPMRLPTMQIKVGGRWSTVRLDEIEKLLRSKREDLLVGVQKSAGQWLNEKLAPTLQKLLSTHSNKILAASMPQNPLGDVGFAPKPFRMRVFPTTLQKEDGVLHFGLDMELKDPHSRFPIELSDSELALHQPLSPAFEGVPFDVALTLNEGVINRLLQLSGQRGYYDWISGNQGMHRLNHRPLVEFKSSGHTNEGYVKMSVYKYVSGLRSLLFSENPIVVNFKILAGFKVINNKVQMIAKGVNLNSVNIPGKYIRVLSGRIHKAAKEELEEIGRSLKGTVLAADIPLPLEQLGVPYSVTEARIDPMGHLAIFVEFEKSCLARAEEEQVCRADF